MDNLTAKEDETVKLSQEKNNLSTITNNLQENLSSIEQRTQLLQKEKLQFEEKYVLLIFSNSIEHSSINFYELFIFAQSLRQFCLLNVFKAYPFSISFHSYVKFIFIYLCH